MDNAERALFSDTIRQLTVEHSGGELDTALDEVGWGEALAAERATAVSVLFEAQGANNVTSSALDQLLIAALGLRDTGSAALVLPALRTHEPPGRLDGSQLTVRGLCTEALARRGDVAVVATRNDAHESYVVPRSAVKVAPVHGLDPGLALVEISGEVETEILSPPVAADWVGAMMAGHLALGHELVGTGRTMLELARVHALERVQFGRPIASFQAVRHRLAESLVALEAAAALLDAAWEEADPVIAAMAKASAGRSARTVARHCQQVLAGIGFTTEHSFHRYFRRTVVLDQLLGAGTELTRRLGRDVLASGSLPPTLPL